ncbi:MAG: YccF domain-containing protein [Acetobacteraceae bacterium]
MTLLRLLLNVLWIITGGIWMAAAWIIAGCLMLLSIIGIPWAFAAFRIAAFTLLPFGHRVVQRSRGMGRGGPGSGPLGVLGNIIWLLLAGWWLALAHLVAAVLLAITVIGIPFAWAHLKLAGLALWPVGTEIVPVRTGLRPQFRY